MERRLAAILSADVAGYSRMMEADEVATHDALVQRRREIVEPLIRQYHGRIVKLTGDGALVEFASAVDAVICARAIQQGMAERNEGVPEEQQILFRIGINVGDIIFEEEDIYGTGVNVAARLQELAEPGGIFVSQSVAENARSLAEISFEYLGEREVKNIADAIEVYRVGAAGIATLQRGHRKAGRPARWRGVAALGLLIVAVAAVVAGWVFWYGKDDYLALPKVPSVAVLPFDNLSADPSQEYLARGISEDLITNLAKVPDLFVIARNSSFTYGSRPVDIVQVGRELGIRYVVEGSVQRSSQMIRVTAQVIDATNGRHLWAERYDRPIEDLFAIQDSVTAAIAGTMIGTTGVIAGAETSRLASKNPTSFNAYDYLMRGWEAWYRFTAEDNEKARAFFQQSLAVDPDYARAYAGLAWTHAMDYEYDWTEDYEGAVDQVLQLAQRAIQLDSRDYRNHWILGWAHLYHWNHDLALASYNRARELNPNDAELMAEMASLLIYIGQPEQAISQLKEAMRRNPLHDPWYREYLGWAYEEAGRPEDCIETMTQVIDPEPTGEQLWLLRTLAACYASPEVDRMDDAKRVAAQILELDPDFSMAAHKAYVEEVFPYRSQELIDRWIAAFSRVGLPE
ncbi:MAG: adenylate/guanylate cyclase domain-containing protein [Oricola sp.]